MAEYVLPDPIVQVMGAQDVRADTGVIERCPGERNIDEAGPKPGGRIGQVGLADADVHAGVACSEGGGQSWSGPFGAVGERAQSERGGTGRRGDSRADLISLGQQSAGLVVQRHAGRGERDARGRAVQQDGAKISLQVFDGSAQRRLGHLQPRSGPAEVKLLGDGHKVAQQA